MRWRRALTGRSTDETVIGSSFHDEGNSMLKPRPRSAQDSTKNALSCPQWQSREAGSCLGAEQTIVARSSKLSWRRQVDLNLGPNDRRARAQKRLAFCSKESMYRCGR
jgi:hypothetical protein